MPSAFFLQILFTFSFSFPFFLLKSKRLFAIIYMEIFPGIWKREREKDMGKYITEAERYRIEALLKSGSSPCQVAAILGRHFTTIYKEIKKGTVTLLNSDLTFRREYCADAAQRVTDGRQANKGRGLKIGNDHELARHIEYLIGGLHYSPYAAVQDIRKRGTFRTDICETTLYSYIDKGLFLNISNDDLYSKSHKRRQKHNTVTRPSHKKLKGKSIDERPAEAGRRDAYGHWEMDTVCSGKKKGKGCILALTERMTLDEHTARMPDRTLASTVRVLDRLEQSLGYEGFCRRFKTITVDNGSEFGDSSLIERSCIYPDKKRTSVYFCHPYSSFERGSNENANKLIRRFVPKGSSISSYSDEYIQNVQEWINSYPRKIFGGLSSSEYKAALGIC